MSKVSAMYVAGPVGGSGRCALAAVGAMADMMVSAAATAVAVARVAAV